ncbi:glycosyl hydrolase [Arcicella sp. LKC2W]|uniref:glycosyl hydrolase n=1 Tax=Arcicella sp. LKC2W TaxID=2984198 RepID=UPI002B1EE117|nr:glycosyl hydrolase [Arcicella sp. LKC2W]MEA5460940.1 glycosyl hydrolase [Arcicella sp. LKC2W]
MLRFSYSFLGIFILMFGFNTAQSQNWFPKYNFNPTTFKKPSQNFGPMARWWWSGNDVNVPELQREINLFADNAFAGVEIQTLKLGMPITPENRDKIFSWDTPLYYENVKSVMEEARKRGLIIDMTNGSGWPAGSSILQGNDGFRNLKFNAITVEGGKRLTVALPKVSSKIGSSILQAVVATQIAGGKENVSLRTTPLDINSTIILTQQVVNDSVTCTLPVGYWKVIAYWSLPSGEMTMTAEAKQGYVVDHFNSEKVLKLYNYLFGERTGLKPYFGNPMRAIFNDSYEFKADRHYSVDFINWFKKHRGYDPVPYLSANMQRGYNYVSFANPNAPKDFTFDAELDTRIRHDYDLTLSELLGEHFLKTSKDFMEKQGLLHRTQTYGLNMDMMAIAGLASIPEMESMLASEANMKIVSSGAHLYNRPLVSSESVVFVNRAYMTTPQKTRLAVDKLFAAGANQIIYHGIPYRYFPKDFAKEGWYPFSSAVLPVNFSSHFGESDIFWKYQKDLNQYIQRTQYALRAGKAKTDVLIYFPYMNVDKMPENPTEIMTMGEISGIEPPLKKAKEQADEKSKWAEKTWKIINQLEAKGITWEWVNDKSIQEAKLTNDKQINIRGNIYQALILSENSTIELQSAQQITKLASQGMRFLNAGSLPTKQPSFLNWAENDKKVATLLKLAIQQKNSIQIVENEQVDAWIASLKQSVKFNDLYHFTRQIQREMSDGSRIQFIWNKSDQWQTMSLSLDKKYIESYWMNAEDGTITQNDNQSKINYQIPPYSSVILYASTKSMADKSSLSKVPINPTNAKTLLTIDKWSIQADTVKISNSALFDWKTNDSFKYIGTEAIYQSSFDIKGVDSDINYFLDLGKVYHTAEVFINGKWAGKRIISPYRLAIGKYLKSGINQIEIRVLPTLLNHFIGEAVKGNPHYKQFKKSDGQLMSNGLVGEVKILEIK